MKGFFADYGWKNSSDLIQARQSRIERGQSPVIPLCLESQGKSVLWSLLLQATLHASNTLQNWETFLQKTAPVKAAGRVCEQSWGKPERQWPGLLLGQLSTFESPTRDSRRSSRDFKGAKTSTYDSASLTLPWTQEAFSHQQLQPFPFPKVPTSAPKTQQNA